MARTKTNTIEEHKTHRRNRYSELTIFVFPFLKYFFRFLKMISPNNIVTALVRSRTYTTFLFFYFKTKKL